VDFFASASIIGAFWAFLGGKKASHIDFLLILSYIKFMSDEHHLEKAEKTEDTDRIAWHPAFRSAIKLQFEAYSDVLEFKFETELNDEPLKVDAVIIKKLKDVEIKQDIAAIFRKDNICEFKSPTDYFSVADFYKVYGYACFYLYLNKDQVDVTDLTITVVETRHPRDLLNHLKEVRGYQIEEPWSGIYHVKGNIIPIQIIESKRLTSTEDLWLRGLGNRLGRADALALVEKTAKHEKDADIRAYFYAIIRANPGIIEEAFKMSDIDLAFPDTELEFQQALEKVGLVAKWEAKGEARGEARGKEEKALEIAKNLLTNGFSVEQAAKLAELDIEKVKVLTKNI
jgi:hypothetical protein